MKLSALRVGRGQGNFSATSPSPYIVSSDDGTAIPSERQFGEQLCLERRRAERSRKPFLLMLIDLQKHSGGDGVAHVIHRVWSSVCTASRDSDIRGWYREETVLGVIFVEINPDSPVSAIEVIHAKVLAALSQCLNSEELGRLTIRLYLQPDTAANWQQWSSLYRDLQERENDGKVSRALKRAIDVAGSATALLVLAPLMGLLALLIKLTSRGPVFFRQPRVGYRGTIFTFLKFRTMHHENDAAPHKDYIRRFIAGETRSSGPAPVFKMKDDPRITTIGRFLRKSSLDELPQFWNVLRGEMSLVGPRPPILYEMEFYDVWHRRRVLEVKPGITGLWQVRGRSRTTFDEMVRLDLRYAKTWSLWLDLEILFETPRAVISGGGAY